MKRDDVNVKRDAARRSKPGRLRLNNQTNANSGSGNTATIQSHFDSLNMISAERRPCDGYDVMVIVM